MSRRIWTPSDLGYLIKHYPDTPTVKIAAALGRNISQIYAMAKRSGLKKSQEFFNGDASGRLKGERGQSTRFKAGDVSWNKGLNYQPGGRCPETQFKPGAHPHNQKPIGSYRINGEGYLDLKVNNDKGANHVRWHPVHRIVWERENGPTPPGSMIVFKPGMRTNILEEITIDKVECITRAENARRNGPNARGPEFGQLVRLKGAITRQVNRITREATA